MQPDLIWIDATSEWYREVLAVRHAVFVEEEGVPEHLEVDEQDAQARHLAAVLPALHGERAAVVIGALRLVVGTADAIIGRVAVRQDWRRRGLGTRLVIEALAECSRRGCRIAVLNAQETVVAFYSRLGFKVSSGPFLDAGIRHLQMVRSIGAVPDPGRLGETGFP